MMEDLLPRVLEFAKENHSPPRLSLEEKPLPEYFPIVFELRREMDSLEREITRVDLFNGEKKAREIDEHILRIKL